MQESSPLSSRQNSQQQVRTNLIRTLDHKIYTSYLLLTFSSILTITKIISALYILSYKKSTNEVPLFLWNLISIILDFFYLILKAFRFPYMKRARNGEEIEEFYVLQVMFVLQTTCYVVWQIPGNVWYWKCDECFDNAPALAGLTLGNLILGYFYLLGPVLIILSICICLPVAIIFVIFISGNPQMPASEDMLVLLESENYDIQKHIGGMPCTICANEYFDGDKITVMKCDNRHIFHYECIKKWLQINANCPICRAPYLLIKY